MPYPPGVPRWIWARASLVFALAAGFLYRIQFDTPTIPAYDGWFHIKYAALLPSLGFSNEFKWAAQSVWATDFADKELLFHLFLVPFAQLGDMIVGVKLATVLLGAGVVVSFFLVLALNRLRYPEAWSLLLLASGDFFLYRLCLPRPHLLSMILLLWSVHLILNRKRLALAIVLFVYALGYTAYHLPLALAVMISVDLFLTRREFDWKTPLSVVAGMTLGILVNPYFPDNFRIFWAHAYTIPLMSIQSDLGIQMASELRPLTTRHLLLSHLGIAALCLGAGYLALVRPRPTDRKTRGLFLVFCVYLLMALMIRRFVEYSVPMTLFFLAAFYTTHLSGFHLLVPPTKGGQRRWSGIAVATVLLIALAGLLWQTSRGTLAALRDNPPALRDAALYLEAHTEQDELVFTCDWDDSPQLFFYNDKNIYPILMDPVLMYLKDPVKWREWEAIGNGEFSGRTYDMLARDYRYGVCTWDFEELREIVETDPRMEIVHDDDGAYVFRVDRDNPEIGLDKFLDLASEP